MPVPARALYGAQTARAVDNFPISGWRMPREFIAALGLIKQCCAQVSARARRVPPRVARAIVAAAAEVAAGKLDEHFPLDVFQTGSATSTNMNANEVIARRAMQLLPKGAPAVHPNDHVNLGQSSNDVIPSAMHLAVAAAIRGGLLAALRKLAHSLAQKARQFDDVVKIGRTHLMDAVPVRLGQEFGAYAAQVTAAADGLERAADALCELPLGGTAVGTGLNAPKGFAREVCRTLSARTGLKLREAQNHFAAQASKDACAAASGALKVCAVALSKVASDVRLMGSGPRCGLGELVLPATQPGSSIMPGKVNPVICESVVQVCCQVVGCDAAVTLGAFGGVGGILELNVAMPMIAWNLLTMVGLLTSAASVFESKCIRGLRANVEQCRRWIEQSLAMVTVLAPRIGYDAAAEIAKEAARSGKTIRQLCTERGVLPQRELARLLDARSQTGR
jgi:fumarate hydratase class II